MFILGSKPHKLLVPYPCFINYPRTFHRGKVDIRRMSMAPSQHVRDICKEELQLAILSQVVVVPTPYIFSLQSQLVPLKAIRGLNVPEVYIFAENTNI